MADIVEELKKKRKVIEQFQRDQANQEGQEAQLLKRLKDESDTDDIPQAEKKLEDLGKELVEHEDHLKKLDTTMGKIITNARGSNSESSDQTKDS